MKTRMDSSKHSETICVRDAGQESEMFLDNLSGQEMYSPKPANGLSKGRNGLSVLLVDCPFCGSVAFWRKLLLSNWRLWRLQNAWLLFKPSFCWLPSSPWAYVSLHLIGGFFLLWSVIKHLNMTPSRTAIKLCARCTLEEGY